MSRITIRNADGKWTVRAGGAVLGESAAALELTEGEHPFVIYFPKDDLAMAFLELTDHRTTCPQKGEASYYSIVTKSKTIVNAAWSYETPIEDVSRIAGYIAFHASDEVAIEHI